MRLRLGIIIGVLVPIAALAFGGYLLFGVLFGPKYTSQEGYQRVLDEVRADFGADPTILRVSLNERTATFQVLVGDTVRSKRYGGKSNKASVGSGDVGYKATPGDEKRGALTLARLERVNPEAMAREVSGAGPSDVLSFEMRRTTKNGYVASITTTVDGVFDTREVPLP